MKMGGLRISAPLIWGRYNGGSSSTNSKYIGNLATVPLYVNYGLAAGKYVEYT